MWNEMRYIPVSNPGESHQSVGIKGLTFLAQILLNYHKLLE
jgi:hypothetical protein